MDLEELISEEKGSEDVCRIEHNRSRGSGGSRESQENDKIQETFEAFRNRISDQTERILKEWREGKREDLDELNDLVIEDSENMGDGKQLLMLSDKATGLAHFAVLHPDGHLGAVEG